MKRKQFLKICTIAGVGILTAPHISFKPNNQEFDKNFLIGKSNYEFKGPSWKMEQETYAQFLSMKKAAKSAGFNIEVVSAYRSFERQKQIFEGKYKRFTKAGLAPLKAIEKIIEYSTIPGTSRHHWGTDIDIIDANGSPRPSSVLQAKHFHGSGPFCKLKEWLNKNAANFGFYEVYTDNANRKGFKYEPWHFSYAPVSKQLLTDYRKLDVKQILLEEKLLGAEYFTDAFILKYRTENILDINPELIV
ncbi:peptidase M15B and M15C, D,D-carboxypeptidase VanY/endolysin [unidentified eubacterium SCB49]|nr:peptidase M15B and M15C, D,D-carboxypeptidase VanY/endolysin [unidentified eubacterium SCB49]